MEKVVIITGAAGGLGSEIARRFGAGGYRVVVNDIARAQKAAEKLGDEINQGPGQAFAYQADVRNYEELKGMVEETVKRWDRVDVVVNTAGGTLAMLTKKENKLLLEHTEEEWDLVVDVNLKGSFNCLRAVAPQMIKQKEGHIILVSSGTGIRPGKLMSSYAAAKSGVNGLMKAAARELGEYNIKVNAINPGLVTHRQLVLGGVTAEGYITETTLGRLTNPEEVANFVVRLAEMNNISGQILNMDSRVLF
jgi:3-oxoacyl-[acyl-carrier protein] reductase